MIFNNIASASNTKLLILLLIFGIGLAGINCKSISRLVDKGGTVFTVEIQTDAPNRNEIIERTVKITQHKLDAVGVDGEAEQVAGKDNQMSVKIYGSHNADKIEALKKFLFTAYQLELKKVVSPMNPAPLQSFPTKEEAEQKATKDQEVLPYNDDYDPRAAFVIVEKQAIVTGEDVRTADAYSATDQDGDYSIAFTLHKEGAQKLGDWTGKNIGNYLAIVLDKKVQSAPFVRGQIFDSGQIDGRFTRETAENIALALKSGYLPAQIKVIEEKPFGN